MAPVIGNGDKSQVQCITPGGFKGTVDLMALRRWELVRGGRS